MSNAEPISSCPPWGEWLDERHVAVICKECRCTYTGRYPCPAYINPKRKWLGGVPKKCTVCAKRKIEEARKALPINLALIAAVKQHAMDNYNHDGWDYIVESYTDEELWQEIAGAKDVAGAIKKAHSLAKLLSDRRDDIRSTAW